MLPRGQQLHAWNGKRRKVSSTTPAAAPTGSALLTLIVAAVIGEAAGEIYEFEQAEIPLGSSLVGVEIFSIATDGAVQAVGPIVEFRDFQVQGLRKPVQDGQVQVSLVQFRGHSQLAHVDRVCCDALLLAQQKCARVGELFNGTELGDVYAHTVDLDRSTSSRLELDRRGTYMLAVSNCGTAALPGATVSGKILVRSAHGLMPAADHPKLRLYYYLLLFYSCVTLFCMALAGVRGVSARPEIRQARLGCIVAAILAVLEALAWYLCLRSWNQTGDDSHVGLGYLASAVKYAWAYTMVLLVVQGTYFGCGLSASDSCDAPQGWIVCQFIVYLCCVLPSRWADFYLLRKAFSTSLVLVCTLPLHFFLLAWWFRVFLALRVQIAYRNDMGHEKTQRILVLTRMLFLIVLTCAFVAVVAEFGNVLGGPSTSWETRWLYAEATWHVLYALTLTLLLVIWNQDSEERVLPDVVFDPDCDIEDETVAIIGAPNSESE